MLDMDRRGYLVGLQIILAGSRREMCAAKKTVKVQKQGCGRV